MVSLFWSFSASRLSAQTAKQGNAVIISLAQIGAVVGPYMTIYSKELGIQTLCFFAGQHLLQSARLQTQWLKLE